jgi:hypothetical protein
MSFGGLCPEEEELDASEVWSCEKRCIPPSMLANVARVVSRITWSCSLEVFESVKELPEHQSSLLFAHEFNYLGSVCDTADLDTS